MLYYGPSAVMCGGRGGRKPFLAKSFLGVLRDCTRKRVSASLEPKIVFLEEGGGGEWRKYSVNYVKLYLYCSRRRRSRNIHHAK